MIKTNVTTAGGHALYSSFLYLPLAVHSSPAKSGKKSPKQIKLVNISVSQVKSSAQKNHEWYSWCKTGHRINNSRKICTAEEGINHHLPFLTFFDVRELISPLLPFLGLRVDLWFSHMYRVNLIARCRCGRVSLAPLSHSHGHAVLPSSFHQL